MTRIAIITGSTRPGRINHQVAQWVLEQTADRTDAEFEIVDIADFNLPVLDEAYPAAYQNYQNDHTKAFSAKIAEFDGYIFIVAEYNHSISGALKNALDYLNVEFNNKAAGFVSYGSKGGVRAVEHLRGIASELQLAHVRNQVMFSIFSDVENFNTFKPTEQSAAALAPMLDQLILWTRAMEFARSEALVTAG
ncbi:NADPH-dependent FMN reductase family protein [Pseudarthrobacter siccitolerans]|uniref:NADPH-dependent FMN reductase family protein n=1 Tax=Pseudarthrobacter siccitolerans TaxID=861266 RepID=A0A024GY76_9MICC|nr:NAD(P)H-dependent oxidoreductase [Pseudarthrobacter siccitolerans]CCQ44434.1 NADPH-dependent FMN reductase family protein [Pseudarthrobacter siccitolerans]